MSAIRYFTKRTLKLAEKESGISRRTLERLLEKGVIKKYKLGACTLIDMEELNTYIESTTEHD